MNRKLAIGVIAVAIIAVVAAVALLMMKPEGGSGSGLAQVGLADRTAEGAGDVEILAGAASGPGGKAARPRQPVGPASPDRGSGAAADASKTLPSKYGPEFWAGLNFFEDPEKLEELLKEFGGFEGLYAAAPADVRAQLVDYLLYEGRLREQLAGLLSLEADSSARADMLTKVLPKGFFEDNLDPSRPIDPGLKEILDRRTRSPINEGEWMARMNLAALLDLEFAVDVANQAESAYPDSPSVRVTAAAQKLQLYGGGARVSSDQRRRAEEYLTGRVQDPTWIEMDQDDRIQAYYGLFYASDRTQVRALFESALEQEPDGQPRRVLEDLLAQI